VDAQTAIVKETAAKMGATITDAQARAMGETAYRTGYNGQQLQQALGTYVASGAPGTKAPGGVAGQTEQTLKDYAASMGVQLSDSYFQGAEKSVAAGLSDATTWQNDIKEQAKSLYVPMAARIDQGATVADMASSYVNQMASTLEVDPNTINLQDTTIQKALKGTVDQKTGQPALQSLWDFDQTLKQDPRWQYTKNANQLAASTASSVLQLMGFQ
jgi:hypothetical protein